MLPNQAVHRYDSMGKYMIGEIGQQAMVSLSIAMVEAFRTVLEYDINDCKRRGLYSTRPEIYIKRLKALPDPTEMEREDLIRHYLNIAHLAKLYLS